MIIADLQLPNAARKERIGIVGSCRVHDPFKEVVRAGRGEFLWSSYNAFTHSPLEAKQHIDFCRGLIELPDAFAPYIFRRERTPDLDPKFIRLVDQCTTFLVEISTNGFLRCGAYYFQQDYFAQQFVRGAGLPMLEWYRELSTSPPAEQRVAAAIAHLRAAGKPVRPSTEEILRNTRQGNLTEEQFTAAMIHLMFDPSKTWIFVPHLNIISSETGGLKARSPLRESLSKLAQAHPIGFFDPMPIIEARGRNQAYDGGGTDICHYAPEFLPVMGEAMFGAVAAILAKRK